MKKQLYTIALFLIVTWLGYVTLQESIDQRVHIFPVIAIIAILLATMHNDSGNLNRYLQPDKLKTRIKIITKNNGDKEYISQVRTHLFNWQNIIVDGLWNYLEEAVGDLNNFTESKSCTQVFKSKPPCQKVIDNYILHIKKEFDKKTRFTTYVKYP